MVMGGGLHYQHPTPSTSGSGECLSSSSLRVLLEALETTYPPRILLVVGRAKIPDLVLLSLQQPAHIAHMKKGVSLPRTSKKYVYFFEPM